VVTQRAPGATAVAYCRVSTQRQGRSGLGLEAQPVNEEQVRAARRAYYGAVSYIDDQVGVLLPRKRLGIRPRLHKPVEKRDIRRLQVTGEFPVQAHQALTGVQIAKGKIPLKIKLMRDSIHRLL